MIQLWRNILYITHTTVAQIGGDFPVLLTASALTKCLLQTLESTKLQDCSHLKSRWVKYRLCHSSVPYNLSDVDTPPLVGEG